jgi:hypothetical protein
MYAEAGTVVCKPSVISVTTINGSFAARGGTDAPGKQNRGDLTKIRTCKSAPASVILDKGSASEGFAGNFPPHTSDSYPRLTTLSRFLEQI